MAARALPRLLFEALLLAVLLATFTRSFLLQGIMIPGNSMEPSLLAGDLVVVNKLIFKLPRSAAAVLLPGRPLRRREVILLRHPDEPSTLLVKRSAGLAGDRVRELADGVRIERHHDGEPASSPPVVTADPASAGLVVPAGHLYVLGDNRSDSLDSRIFGPLDEDLVIGKIFLISWSFDRRGDWTIGEEAARHPRWAALWRHTRWHRNFDSVR